MRTIVALSLLFFACSARAQEVALREAAAELGKLWTTLAEDARKKGERLSAAHYEVRAAAAFELIGDAEAGKDLQVRTHPFPASSVQAAFAFLRKPRP